MKITLGRFCDCKKGEGGETKTFYPTSIKIMLLGLVAFFSINFPPPTFFGCDSERASQSLEGMWAYESLKPSSGTGEFRLTGYFIFHNDHFVQQSINDGEPFEKQGGMAHAGPYQKTEKAYQLDAKIGISVSPTRKPPLSVTVDRKHEIFPEFSEEKLILTFWSGTVQIFRRIVTEHRKIYKLDKGYLAFADNFFIIVTAWEENSVAGSGTFEREGKTLRLHAERWFSVAGEEVEYIKNQIIAAIFDGHTLKLPNGMEFRILK
jgi:hypothetical protein